MNGASCMNCGLLVKNEMFESPCDNFMHSFQSMSVLCQTQTYTRAKRFKKYLQRACMHQSINSVPDATWKHLLDRTLQEPRADPADAQTRGAEAEEEVLRLPAASRAPPVRQRVRAGAD